MAWPRHPDAQCALDQEQGHRVGCQPTGRTPGKPRSRGPCESRKKVSRTEKKCREPFTPPADPMRPGTRIIPSPHPPPGLPSSSGAIQTDNDRLSLKESSVCRLVFVPVPKGVGFPGCAAGRTRALSTAAAASLPPNAPTRSRFGEPLDRQPTQGTRGPRIRPRFCGARVGGPVKGAVVASWRKTSRNACSRGVRILISWLLLPCLLVGVPRRGEDNSRRSISRPDLANGVG